MSDEQQFGQDALEAAHGHFPIHNDPTPEDVLTPSEASEKLDRPEPPAVVERDYIRVRDGEPVRARNEDGTFADGLFERESPQGWVTAEEAGRDLAAQRQAEAKLLKDQEDLEVQRAVDELRRSPIQTGQQPDQPQPAQPQETAAQAFERIKQQSGPPTNDDVRLVLTNSIAELDASLSTETDPQLRSYYETKKAELQQKANELAWSDAFAARPELVGLVEQEVANQVAARTAQVNAALQQKQAEVQSATQLALASLFSEPELQGISADQLPGVLQYLAKNNPQRYEIIANKANSVGRMVQQFALQQQHQQIAQAQHQAAAQQAQAEQFNRWADSEDRAFEAANADLVANKDQYKQLQQETKTMLEGAFNEGERRQLYNSPFLRRAATQQILADAAAYRLLQKNIVERRVAPKPASAMKPGGGAEVDMRRAYEAAPRLPSEFANAKEAAAFITKVRAARR